MNRPGPAIADARNFNLNVFDAAFATPQRDGWTRGDWREKNEKNEKNEKKTHFACSLHMALMRRDGRSLISGCVWQGDACLRKCQLVPENDLRARIMHVCTLQQTAGHSPCKCSCTGD
eukprot:3015566-Pleurochrysis_carterae.AAC.4